MKVEPLAYRPSEVAALLGVSKAAVYRGVASGEIPSIRLGRSVRIPRWWVDERTSKHAA